MGKSLYMYTVYQYKIHYVPSIISAFELATHFYTQTLFDAECQATHKKFYGCQTYL